MSQVSVDSALVRAAPLHDQFDRDYALAPSRLSAAAKRLFTRGPYLLRKLQHLRPFICPFDRILAHIPRGSTVLDVGCGGGLFLGLLHHAGLLDKRSPVGGVGFDLSRSAIDMARTMSQNARGGARLQFEHLDVASPWPEGPFDVVSIIDVMHHVPLDAHKGLLKQAFDCVAPGGRLVYKDMCATSWKSLANKMHDFTMCGELIAYTPIAVVEQWARELGMEVHHADKFDRFCYGHELRVFIKPLNRIANAA